MVWGLLAALQHLLAARTIENVLASIPCSWPYGSIVYSPATGLQEWAVYGAQRGWSMMQKKQGCTHSCYQRSLASIQAHSLPSACRAESCLLCCQPEPSLSRYLLDYHRLLHDSLADCKLKGDELST